MLQRTRPALPTALVLTLLWDQAQPLTCFSKTEYVRSDAVPVPGLSLIKAWKLLLCALENFESHARVCIVLLPRAPGKTKWRVHME